jgi:hypothetical protein
MASSFYQEIYQEAENCLKEVIVVAKNFKCHNKSSTLSLRAIKQALRYKGFDVVHGIDCKRNLYFLPISERYNLLYIPDKIMKIDQISKYKRINGSNTVKLNPHWLAIDGEQTRISKDTSVAAGIYKRKRFKRVSFSWCASSTSLKSSRLLIAPSITYSLTHESALYLDRVIKAIRLSSENLHLNSKVLLTHEIEYRKILHSLRTDSGIQQFVPTLLIFIADRVKQFFKEPKIILTCLAIYDALLQNPTLNMLPFTHKILLIVLATLLNKDPWLFVREKLNKKPKKT